MNELSKFKPLRDGILVRSLESESVTNGGIILPDTSKEKPQSGIVVAVGEGVKCKNGHLVPNDVNLGDKVVFAKWSGDEISFDGQKYLLMKQSDILGIDKSDSSFNSCSRSCDSCKGCF